MVCSPDCFLAFLAILFPPLPVWIKRGICSADSLISFALFCLGYVPGLLHAWYIIGKYPDEYPYGYEPLNGEGYGESHVYYFPVRGPNMPRPQGQSPVPSPGYATFHGPHPHQHPHSNPQQNSQSNPGPQSQSQSHPPQQPTSPTGSTPGRYTNYPQQTDTGIAGPSVPPQGEGLPSYADAVKCDYKVQTHD